MALSTISASGTQTSTQNPQSAGQSSGGGTQSSSVQPGTANSLLTSNGGVALTPAALPTVSLSTTSNQTVSNPPVHNHHANPALVGLSVGLFVLAIIMFWLTGRGEKITTK